MEGIEEAVVRAGGGDVPRLALAEAVDRDRGSARVEVAFVRRHDFGGLGADDVADARDGVAAAQRHRCAGAHDDLVAFVLVEVVGLHRADAEHVAERAGEAAGEDEVRLVGDAGEVGGDEGAALFDEALDARGEAFAKHVELRGDDDVVAVELRVAVDQIHGNAALPVGAIVREGGGIGVLGEGGGAGGRVEHPARFPVEDDGDLGGGAGADDGGEALQLLAQRGDFLEHAVVFAADVVDHGAVEFFAASQAFAELEVADAVRAVRDGLDRLHAVLAGAQEAVGLHPVRGPRGGLHEQEGLAALERAVEVVGEGELHGRAGGGVGAVVVGGIGVPARHVDVLRPAPVVERKEGAHHVDGDRHVGGDRPQRSGLRAEEVEHLVGVEAPAVHDHRGQRRIRHADLAPVREAVRPEAAPPRLVERFECEVLLLEPLAEDLVAERTFAAGVVFVRDVPHRERGVAAVALGELCVDDLALLAVDGRGRAVVVAVALLFAQGVGVGARRMHAADLGILLGHPVGLGAGGRGEDDRHLRTLGAGHDVVDESEVEEPLLGLERGPGEDADRGGVDAGQLEEAEVLVHRAGDVGPLVGIVVPAVEHEGKAGDAAHSDKW